MATCRVVVAGFYVAITLRVMSRLPLGAFMNIRLVRGSDDGYVFAASPRYYFEGAFSAWQM